FAVVQSVALTFDFGSSGLDFGQITQIGCEQPPRGEVHRGEGELKRNDGAVGTHALDFHSVTKQLAVAGGNVSAKIVAVALSEGWGSDQFGDWAANCLSLHMTECALGGRIEGDHAGALVNNDDGVGGGCQDGSAHGFTRLQRR